MKLSYLSQVDVVGTVAKDCKIPIDCHPFTFDKLLERHYVPCRAMPEEMTTISPLFFLAAVSLQGATTRHGFLHHGLRFSFCSRHVRLFSCEISLNSFTI
jgi:hypothetical protein